LLRHFSSIINVAVSNKLYQSLLLPRRVHVPTVVDDFRLFCGDLGNEVTDDTLARAFNKYPSFQKARVVRDKRTNKTKGFGFVSFKDPNDFTRAMREMNGKHLLTLLLPINSGPLFHRLSWPTWCNFCHSRTSSSCIVTK